jgi:hypothetical protein
VPRFGSTTERRRNHLGRSQMIGGGLDPPKGKLADEFHIRIGDVEHGDDNLALQFLSIRGTEPIAAVHPPVPSMGKLKLG